MIWYLKNPDGVVYGPASLASLVAWAKDGRIQPESRLSRDRKTWLAPGQIPELGMSWLIETEPGKIYGPFNRAVVIQLFADGSAAPGTKVYRLHDLAPDKDPPPKVKVVEKIVERVVEKIVEVPQNRALVPVRPQSRGLSIFSLFKPKPRSTNIFANADPKKLAALESALQSELRRSGMTVRFPGGVK